MCVESLLSLSQKVIFFFSFFPPFVFKATVGIGCCFGAVIPIRQDARKHMVSLHSFPLTVKAAYISLPSHNHGSKARSEAFHKNSLWVLVENTTVTWSVFNMHFLVHLWECHRHRWTSRCRCAIVWSLVPLTHEGLKRLIKLPHVITEPIVPSPPIKYIIILCIYSFNWHGWGHWESMVLQSGTCKTIYSAVVYSDQVPADRQKMTTPMGNLKTDQIQSQLKHILCFVPVYFSSKKLCCIKTTVA